MEEWPREKPTVRSYSQYGEDAVIFHFLYLHSRIKDGFYVDIGAFDPVQYSNTFLLHKHGWRGVNIDIVAERIGKFKAARPGDINLLAAVGDADGELDVYEHPQWASMTTVDTATAHYHRSRPVGKIACRTLRGLLEEHEIAHIDYVNIDVEGFEMKVLSTFDPVKYGVSLFTVELLTQDIDAVLGSEVYRYMIDRGYVFCGWTGWTLFFRTPSIAV
jgi:FkbM family methyltransferase